jgi:hypothetical protein
MDSNNSVLQMIVCELDDWDSVPHSGVGYSSLPPHPLPLGLTQYPIQLVWGSLPVVVKSARE